MFLEVIKLYAFQIYCSNMNIHDNPGIFRNKINIYMYQLASSSGNKINLYTDIKDDNIVDGQMTLIDAEFEKIALAINPSVAADRIKYAKEVTDAKIAADEKVLAAVANASTPEDKLKALLQEYELSNPTVDKDAINKTSCRFKSHY